MVMDSPFNNLAVTARYGFKYNFKLVYNGSDKSCRVIFFRLGRVESKTHAHPMQPNRHELTVHLWESTVKQQLGS
eukprot:8621796-Ditylum_brightwellii.AAC.1